LVDLPAGQSIDKSATETALNAISGVSAVVSDVELGKIEFTIAEGTGNVTFPITHVPAFDGVQVFEFTSNNNENKPDTFIEEWQFAMGTTSRQIRITNNSANKRVIIPAPFSRESVPGGDGMHQGNYSSNLIAFNAGQNRVITHNDYVWNNGGGKLEGDIEFSVLKVYEFDATDRLKFTHIHTLHVSCAVGHSFNGNDWRVEVHPV